MNWKPIFKRLIIIFVLNLIILSTIASDDFYELGAYSNYMLSMFYDFDFNIVNEFARFSSEEYLLVTKNLYHSDYHSPFISLLFLPFFILMKVILFFKEENYLLWQTFVAGTLFYLGYIFDNLKRLGLSQMKYVMGILITGSSALWFLLMNPSELSLVCGLFSFLLFLSIRKELVHNRDHYAFDIGLLSFVCLMIKPVLFTIVIPALLILFLNKNKKSFFFGLVGGLFSVILTMLFKILKLGWSVKDHSYEYLAGDFFSNGLNFFMGRNGLIFDSPILVFAVFISLLTLFLHPERKERLLSMMVFFSFCFLQLLMSNLFIPYPEYIGGRNYLVLLPILAYSLSPLFLEKGKRPALMFLLVLLVAGFLLNLGGIIDFDESLSYRFLSFSKRASYFVKYFSMIIDYGVTIKNRLLNNALLYSYSSLCCSFFITLVLYFLNRKEEQGSSVIVPKAIATMILLAFASNFFWAPINIDSYKKDGLYKNAVIVQNAALYYPEVEDIYYKTKKWKDYGYNLDEAALHSRWDQYVKQVRQGIIFDPDGFESSLKSYEEL